MRIKPARDQAAEMVKRLGVYKAWKTAHAYRRRTTLGVMGVDYWCEVAAHIFAGNTSEIVDVVRVATRRTRRR